MSEKQKMPVETQSSRRMKYGLNVLVAAVAALTLVIFLNWIGYRQFVRKDFTAAGTYSLSPQTLSVLRDLQEPYQIVTLLHNSDPAASRARDLVDEYGRRSKAVSVEHLDPAIDLDRLEVVFKSLRERYAGQLKPMQAAVDRGRATLDLIEQQSKDQVALLQTILKDPALGEGDLAGFTQLVSRRIGQLGTEIETNKKDLKEFLKEEGRLPNYTAARDALKGALSGWDTKLYAVAIAQFEKLADASATPAPIKESLLRLADLLKRSRQSIAETLPALDAAAPVADYDQLSSQLDGQANAVVIIGPRLVRVVALEEMFRRPTPEQMAALQEEQLPERAFLGEERITGAIISLGLKNPPLVVFVFTGRQPAIGPGGQYEQVADRLQKLNFKVDQWSPQGRPGPMGQMMPPGPPPKPDAGQKAVWIVLPIDPPNPMNPMAGGGAEQIVPIVQERLDAGDSALVMINASPTARFGGPDLLAQMLQAWGITPQVDRVVLREVVMPNRQKRATNQLDVNQWPADLPITQALASMGGIFLQGVPLELGPVKDGKNGQDGAVKTWPLVVVRGPDLWAETNLQSFPNVKRDAAHAAESFVLGAAAQNKSGRLIAIGDPAWATDQIITVGLLGPGTAELTGAAFPANAELFVNSVLWLGGLDQLIAASARTQDIRRVEAMTPAGYRTLQWTLLLGMPALTLISGLGVWVVRRRG